MKTPPNIAPITFIAVCILFLFTCSQAQTKKSKHPRWNWQKHQTEVINYAKKYLVSNIEPNVPPMGFEKWFQETVGKEAKVEWEINDCGEQTGTSADKGRDFPMCVSADTVKAGFIYISVNIQFGTFNRGITKMKPVVRSITAGDEIGGEWLDNLSDLPKILALYEKTPEHLNPNIGVFKVTGKLPTEFEKVEGMWFKTMDYDPQGKYIWVTPTGGLIVGKVMYELQAVLLDGKNCFFETNKINSVSFKFEGKFAKLRFDSNGAILGENVLQGHLTKLVNGKKSAEGDLNFNFEITEHPCKGCGQPSNGKKQ